MGEIEYHMTYLSIKIMLKHISGYRYETDKEKPRTVSKTDKSLCKYISAWFSLCCKKNDFTF